MFYLYFYIKPHNIFLFLLIYFSLGHSITGYCKYLANFKINTGVFAFHFNAFIDTFELKQHGMFDIEKKKKYDVFCLLFNKETANVCPSFHPYCMRD